MRSPVQLLRLWPAVVVAALAVTLVGVTVRSERHETGAARPAPSAGWADEVAAAADATRSARAGRAGWAEEVAAATTEMRSAAAAEARAEDARRAARQSAAARALVLEVAARADAAGEAVAGLRARAADAGRAFHDAVAAVEAAAKTAHAREVDRQQARARQSAAARALVLEVAARADAAGEAVAGLRARAADAGRAFHDAVAAVEAAAKTAHAREVEAAARRRAAQLIADLLIITRPAVLGIQEPGTLPAPGETTASHWQAALAALWAESKVPELMEKKSDLTRKHAFNFAGEVKKVTYDAAKNKLVWTTSRYDGLTVEQLRALLLPFVREATEKSKLWSDSPLRKPLLEGFEVVYEAVEMPGETLPAPAAATSLDWQAAMRARWLDPKAAALINKAVLINTHNFNFEADIKGVSYDAAKNKLVWTTSRYDGLTVEQLRALLLPLVREATEKSKLWSDSPLRKPLLEGFEVVYPAVKPPDTTPTEAPVAVPCFETCCVPSWSACQPVSCIPSCEQRAPRTGCCIRRRCR